MLRFRRILGPSIASAALLGATVTGVFAAHGGFGGGGEQGGLVGYGTLSSISATSITIATPGGSSLTATLGANATYTARSQGAATGGLVTGDQIALHGSSVNGAATANSVDYDTAVFAAATVRYTGTVSSSSATSLTLSTASGQSVTVQLNSSTAYAVNGTKSTTAPTFTPGQQVRVQAAQMTDGTLVAKSVSATTS